MAASVLVVGSLLECVAPVPSDTSQSTEVPVTVSIDGGTTYFSTDIDPDLDEEFLFGFLKNPSLSAVETTKQSFKGDYAVKVKGSGF